MWYVKIHLYSWRHQYQVHFLFKFTPRFKTIIDKRINKFEKTQKLITILRNSSHPTKTIKYFTIGINDFSWSYVNHKCNKSICFIILLKDPINRTMTSILRMRNKENRTNSKIYQKLQDYFFTYVTTFFFGEVSNYTPFVQEY